MCVWRVDAGVWVLIPRSRLSHHVNAPAPSSNIETSGPSQPGVHSPQTRARSRPNLTNADPDPLITHTLYSVRDHAKRITPKHYHGGWKV